RLARAEPDVAHEHISDGLGRPRVRPGGKLVRPARGLRGQGRAPPARGIRLRDDPSARERYRDLVAGRGRSPDRDRPAPGKHRVVGEERMEKWGLGGVKVGRGEHEAQGGGRAAEGGHEFGYGSWTPTRRDGGRRTARSARAFLRRPTPEGSA